MASKYEVRTFQDIINAVLEELGEKSSNTNTVNKIKRDINAIYMNEVVPDHDWPWLKRTIEVQTETYFNTGTATVTANSPTVTLTQSPAKSYKGYYFAAKGYNEVYKIAQHSANSSTLILESAYTGTTSATSDFTIWSDFVSLPSDCIETIQVNHAHLPHPMEAKGNQDFERARAGALRASGRPKIYTTGEKQYPEPYETISGLPASLTRSASGRIRTVVFASSLGTDGDDCLLWPGDKVEVSGATASAYNGEAVIAEITTTNVLNDTVKYTSEETLNQNSTSDTALVMKKASLDAQLYAFRPLYIFPALLDTRTTLKVSYLVEPMPLIDTTDEPLIPIQDRMVLVYGVLSRQWVKQRDAETAVNNQILFQQKLSKMAGRIEDALDLPRIRPDVGYYNSKRRKPSGGFPGFTNDGFPYGSASSKVTGTASRVAVFDSSGNLVADSNVSTTEVGYLDGVTSNIQTQLNAKLGSEGSSTDTALVRWDGTTGSSLEDSAFSVNDSGDLSGTGSIAVDNLKLDGNTLSSTNSNGDVNLTPNGSGKNVLANAKVSNLSTGIVHADADGDLSSSAIVNADVDASAAIEYSKLDLADSIVNADINSSAGIEYSKLELTDSIVDADIASSAAIAYSKLDLAGSVDLISDVTGTLQIANGGTGQTSQTAAFDALAPTTTKGDLIVHNGTDNIRFGVGSDGQVLTLDSAQTEGVKWADAQTANAANVVQNVGVSASASAGALTVELKQGDGSSDPSAGSPARIAFRSTTITAGGYSLQSYSSALSVVIPSTATLGYSNGADAIVYIYAIYDGTNKELAVSARKWDEKRLHNTTTIGTGSDARNVLYSTTGRTACAVRLIAVAAVEGITTAGTWTAPTYVAIEQTPDSPKLLGRYETDAGQSISSGSYQIVDFEDLVSDDFSLVTTGASWKITAPRAGNIFVSAKVHFLGMSATAGNILNFAIHKNNSLHSEETLEIEVTGTRDFGIGISALVPVKKNDFIDLRAFQNTGGNRTLYSDNEQNYVSFFYVD